MMSHIWPSVDPVGTNTPISQPPNEKKKNKERKEKMIYDPKWNMVGLTMKPLHFAKYDRVLDHFPIKFCPLFGHYI